MEMLISQDWLRRKVESDPDMGTDAGPFINVLESIGMFLPPDLVSAEVQSPRVVEAFGVLVRQFRRHKQWTVEELARRARVDAEDLRQIERHPNVRPRPRIVHQLSEVMGVPERALLKLSGATVTRDQSFEEEAMRFAAKSDDMSKLSREEQRVLNDYVKYLIKQAK
jgi:transcriptional regulator with XRE-family HTH domain